MHTTLITMVSVYVRIRNPKIELRKMDSNNKPHGKPRDNSASSVCEPDTRMNRTLTQNTLKLL